MTTTADLSCACPVLAICGARGSGKTTLLEAVIPELRAQGLEVGLVRLAASGGDAARAVADCGRLARTGCDVHLIGLALARKRGQNDDDRWAEAVSNLSHRYDLVLVEGGGATELPSVWLESAKRTQRSVTGRNVKMFLQRDAAPVDDLLSFLRAWLPEAWRSVPVLGGVLVGGVSSRLGTPKQLLRHAGLSLVERAVAALEPHVSSVVLLGWGRVPPSCEALSRLSDVPGLAGPLAGILAAMRWSHGSAWLFCPCDLPLVTPAAVEWLIGQRAPGRWTVIPRVTRAGVEPLFALYEPQARGVLEAMAAGGVLAPRLVAAHPKSFVPKPPRRLWPCWRNLNSPEDLASLQA